MNRDVQNPLLSSALLDFVHLGLMITKVSEKLWNCCFLSSFLRWSLGDRTRKGQSTLLPNQCITAESRVSDTQFLPLPVSPSLFYVAIYNGPQGKSTFYPRVNLYNLGCQLNTGVTVYICWYLSLLEAIILPL